MARKGGTGEGRRMRKFPKAKKEEQEEEATIQPDWKYSKDIAPSFRGLVLKSLALVKQTCKTVKKQLEKMALPTGDVDLLESHRLICSTIMKRGQDGAPFQLPLKSLRALNAGLQLSEPKLKKIEVEQRGFGIEQPTDTEDQVTALATLKRLVGEQRDVFDEDRDMDKASKPELVGATEE